MDTGVHTGLPCLGDPGGDGDGVVSGTLKVPMLVKLYGDCFLEEEWSCWIYMPLLLLCVLSKRQE